MVGITGTKMLHKLLLRTIGANRAQFAAVVATVFLGIMIFVALTTTSSGLETALTRYYDEYQFAHLFIETTGAPQALTSQIRRIEGVRAAEGRIVTDVRAEIPGRIVPNLRLVSYGEPTYVNGLHLASGRLAARTQAISVAVLSQFAMANDLSEADGITLYFRGEPVRAIISGVVDSPEFVYAIKDARNMFPDYTEFGVAFIPTRILQALTGMEGRVNSIVVTLDKPEQADYFKDLIEERFKQYNVHVYTRDVQPSHALTQAELDGLTQFSKVIPVLFLVVAAIIVYMTVSRMVEAERVSIGIMRALGYSKSAIVGHYTRYALLIGLLGSVPGVIAGYLFTLLMLPFFSMFFRVPGITALHVWQLYPFSIALACVPCALAGFLAGSKATKIIPSEAMRPAAPDVGRRVLFENLHALWSRIGTTTKMVFRGVSRNFRRFVFASLGIAFTFGLILVPIHSVFLFDMLIAKQYGELELYDYSVALASPQDRSVVREVARLSGASHAEPYAEEPLRLSHGWREESVLARAVLPDSSLFLFEADDGTKVSVPDRGILISEFIALQLGVERGSVIAVVSPRDPDAKHYIAVEDVVRQYLGTGAYVSLGQMERILGTKNVINGVALKTEGQVSADLDSAPGVLAVYNATALINAYNELMEMGTYSLSMMVFFGCALGFAVLFTTSSISLSERLREFATMRVLGFHRREILAMVAKENFAALVSGVLLGIPLGYGLCIGIARTFSSEMYFLPEDVLPLPYFVCGGITVVFFGLVMMALWRRISRLQFMDALKTRIT